MTSTTKPLSTRVAAGLMFSLIMIVTLISPVSAAKPLIISTSPIILFFDSLPGAQGWGYLNGTSGVPATSIFSNVGNFLHMDSMGKGASGFAYRRLMTINPTMPFTLYVRASVNAYEGSNNNPHGFDLSVFTGSLQYEVGISPDRIFAGDPNGQFISDETRDVTDFHDYRIESNGGGSFEVFQDDVSLGIASASPSSAESSIYFGDGTAGANANVDIAYYYFTQGLKFRLPFESSFPISLNGGPGCRDHTVAKNQAQAIDYALPPDTTVVASEAGTVIFAGESIKNGYGKLVQIEHSDKSVSFYAHLSQIDVAQGNVVWKGAPLGLSGQTGGTSTGPHLHFEIRKNTIGNHPRTNGTGINITYLPKTLWTNPSNFCQGGTALGPPL